MKISGNAQRWCRSGPAAWFSGLVWMDEVVEPVAPSRVQTVLVTFAPSARTNWHTHPVGQTLYILSGIGWVQKKGEEALVIRAGDSVAIAPGEVHWHGADAAHTMVHFAVQEMDESGQNVVWGVGVSDEEYLAARGTEG